MQQQNETGQDLSAQRLDWIEQGLTSPPTQYRLAQRNTSQIYQNNARLTMARLRFDSIRRPLCALQILLLTDRSTD